MDFKEQFKEHIIPSEDKKELPDEFMMLDLKDRMFHSLKRSELDKVIPTKLFKELELIDGTKLKETPIYTNDEELSRYEHTDIDGNLYYAVKEYSVKKIGYSDPYKLKNGKEIKYPKYDFEFVRTIGYIKQD